MLVLLLSQLFMSCGLIDMDFDPVTQRVLSLTFTYDTVYVMEQDTFFLAPYIYPDDVGSKSVLWEAENTKIVGCYNDTIVAEAQGETRVIATTVSNGRSDTCTVIVMPRWEVDTHTYPYDMTIYADIQVDGKVPGKQMVFGAFCDDEPRGLAIPLDEERTLYRFRVWSHSAADPDDPEFDEDECEPITFRAYNRTTLQMYDLKVELPFIEGYYGSPSDPYKFSLTQPLPPPRKEVE